MPSSPSKPRQRRPVKQEQVLSVLRRQIVSGRLPPRSRLPNQLALVKRYGVSNVTMQRVIGRLVDEGFLETHPRRGVFVGAAPPHLADYALVFPHARDDLPKVNRFLSNLSQNAEELAKQEQRRAVVYHGLQRPDGSRNYLDLAARVQHHRVAGLIFLTWPGEFKNSCLLTEPGIPRVAIMEDTHWPHISAVRINPAVQPVLDWLQLQQARRLAMITTPDITEDYLNKWREGAAQRGMILDRHRILCVSRTAPHWAYSAALNLLDMPADVRPDGLIIDDDNLVPSASAGIQSLAQAGHLPLRIAAHGNFPAPTDCLVPAMRYGPDTREVFATCINILDRAREKQSVPHEAFIPIRTEEPGKPTSN